MYSNRSLFVQYLKHIELVKVRCIIDDVLYPVYTVKNIYMLGEILIKSLDYSDLTCANIQCAQLQMLTHVLDTSLSSIYNSIQFIPSINCCLVTNRDRRQPEGTYDTAVFNTYRYK